MVFTFVSQAEYTIIFLKCTPKSFRDNHDEYYSLYFSSSTLSINSATKNGVKEKNWEPNVMYVKSTRLHIYFWPLLTFILKSLQALFLWSSMRQHLKMFFVLDIQNVKKFLHYFFFCSSFLLKHSMLSQFAVNYAVFFHFLFLWTSS